MGWRKGLVVVCLQLVLLIVGSPPTLASSPLPPEASVTTVEGVIYCKCKLNGYVASLNASPLQGAQVELKCSLGGKVLLSVPGETNDKGYFTIKTNKITKAVTILCKLFVVSSPVQSCPVPADLAPGGKGGGLIFENSREGSLFSAGFFEFAPPNPSMCPPHP